MKKIKYLLSFVLLILFMENVLATKCVYDVTFDATWSLGNSETTQIIIEIENKYYNKN